VVKPSRPTANSFLTRVITDRSQLGEVVADAGEGTDVLAQELVQGPLMSVALVIDGDGQVRAVFHHLSLRLWPARAGSSSHAVGVEPRPDVQQRTAAMLQSVSYLGLAQVDYVSTQRGPVVLDVNPRFYASMSLALASGVNLPYAWHEALCGVPYSPPRPYRTGVRFRVLEADLSQARHGDWRALRPVARPCAGAVWSHRDPLPGTVAAAEVVARVVGARVSSRATAT